MWYVCALRLRDLGDGQVSYFTSLRRWISRKWQKISSAASLGLLAALAAVVWYTCHQVPQFYHCCPRKDSKDSTESRTITARTFGLESGSPTPVPPMCQDLLAVQKAINMSGASQYVLWFSVFFSRGLNMVKVQRLSYAGDGLLGAWLQKSFGVFEVGEQLDAFTDVGASSGAGVIVWIAMDPDGSRWNPHIGFVSSFS